MTDDTVRRRVDKLEQDVSQLQMGVQNKLHKIELQITELTSEVRSDLTERSREIVAIKRLIDRHDQSIHGNGQAGLSTRVDRLETVEKDRKWSTRLIWSSIIGLFVGLIIMLVKFMLG